LTQGQCDRESLCGHTQQKTIAKIINIKDKTNFVIQRIRRNKAPERNVQRAKFEIIDTSIIPIILNFPEKLPELSGFIGFS